MKFILFVEGHTEKQALTNFLKRWLDPRLDPAIAYEKCPYLRELFDEMLKIAREAGL